MLAVRHLADSDLFTIQQQTMAVQDDFFGRASEPHFEDPFRRCRYCTMLRWTVSHAYATTAHGNWIQWVGWGRPDWSENWLRGLFLEPGWLTACPTDPQSVIALNVICHRMVTPNDRQIILVGWRDLIPTQSSYVATFRNTGATNIHSRINTRQDTRARIPCVEFGWCASARGH